MSGYRINEKDIEAVLDQIRRTNPENASREYAIKKLAAMNELAKELVNKDLEFAELLAKAMEQDSMNSPTSNAETLEATGSSSSGCDDG